MESEQLTESARVTPEGVTEYSLVAEEVTSTAAAQIYVGPFRVYWEAENMWAIDRGTTETWATYPEVYINCPVATRTQPANDNDKEPRAWVEGYGVISVAGDGAAFIYAHR